MLLFEQLLSLFLLESLMEESGKDELLKMEELSEFCSFYWADAAADIALGLPPLSTKSGFLSRMCASLSIFFASST